MGDTNIEWTDATWNPVRGCTKISPGCKHCYAETFAERFRGVKGHPYERGFDLRLAPDKLDAPLDWKKPRRVFVNSMSDLFHEDVPEDYLADVFRVMAVCPQHTFQILTKRAERMADVLKRMHLVDGRPRIASQKYRGDSRFEGPPLPNVWLGVSVEDQAYADWRIPHLLKTPAAVRFLSCEPLLGPVDLSDLLGLEGGHGPPGTLAPVHRPGIDWVIVGGESGHGARPMRLEWARDIVAQCKAAGVAPFVKQLGANPIRQTEDDELWNIGISRKGGNPSEWPEDLRVREYPETR